jgi:glutamyl-tRNA synthetase
LSTLREAGIRPEILLGLLAWSCGWVEKGQSFSARDLVTLFRLDAIPKQPFVFEQSLLLR